MSAPPESADQQIMAQLLIELAKIGVVPADWLTDPDVVLEGSPADAIDQTLNLQLYLDHYQTTNRDEDGSTMDHAWWFRGRVWIFARVTTDSGSFGRKTLRRAAADIERVLQSAEATFTTMTGDEGLRCGTYQVRRDVEAAGFAVASLDVDIKRQQPHGST